MTIAVRCTGCQSKLNAPPAAAGKSMKCPKCQAVLRVPAAEPEGFEVVKDDFEVVDEPPPIPKPPMASAPKQRPTLKRDHDEEDEDDDRPRKSGKKRKRQREEQSAGASGNMITGILMMVGAVAWFVAGIVWMDRIFFYPPILFVLGLVAMVRGMTGKHD
jgi:phage FluMu protein Com